MYEETKIKFDWKGFLIKFAILILVVILVIKLLPFERKNGELSEAFNSNLSKLKATGSDFFTEDNLPKTTGESKTITLEDLENTGKISELHDSKGKNCDKTSSYIKAMKKSSEYEIEVHLVCGTEESTTYVYKQNYDTTTTTTTTTTVATTKKNNNVSNGNANTNTNSGGSYVKTTKQTITYTQKVTKAKKYAIVFNSNGGTSITSQYVKYGATATKPTNPTRSGYTFNGWYLNGKTYSFGTSVTSNIKLDASWTKNGETPPTTDTNYYTVKFDSNGGSYVYSQTIASGHRASKPYNPTKSNSSFIGWYYKGKLYNFNTAVTKNITLTAVYETTETFVTNVYSTGYGSSPRTTFTVNHKLAIPKALDRSDYNDVRIKSLRFVRTLSTSTDMYNYSNQHSSTFEYNYTGNEYFYGVPANYAYISYATVSKANYGTYDRNVTWTGTVGYECGTKFNGNCLYGILYTVIWEYEVIE